MCLARKVKMLTSNSPHSKISVKTEKKSENQKFIGAHVSISGGLSNAVYGAVEIGARAIRHVLEIPETVEQQTFG